MMSALDHPLVQDYLRHLHGEALRLPVPEARELEAQIREHLTAALGQQPTEAEVRQTLDRLGEPAELVDAAGGAVPGPGLAQPDRREDGAWREVGALVALVAAAVLFWLLPVSLVLWLGGLVLLVLSRRWSVADKVWGALVLGVGPWLVIVAGAAAWVTTSQVCTTDPAGVTTCTGGGDGGLTALNVVSITLTAAYLVLYVWTLVRLARAASRRPHGR